MCHRQRVRCGRNRMLLDPFRLEWYRRPAHGLSYTQIKWVGMQGTCISKVIRFAGRSIAIVCSGLHWVLINRPCINYGPQSDQVVVYHCYRSETQHLYTLQRPSAKKSAARTSKPSSSPFSAFDLELLSSNRIHLLLFTLRRSQVQVMFLLLTKASGGWAYALASGCCIMPRAISRGVLLWLYYLKEAEYECSGWTVTIVIYSPFSAQLLVFCSHENYNVRQAYSLTADCGYDGYSVARLMRELSWRD